VIFPRICFIGDNEWALVTDGVVLTKSQSLAALEEVEVEERERRKPSSPTTGKTPKPMKFWSKATSLSGIKTG
jgi:hypothetical protein